MASIVLGSTTVMSESSGTVSIADEVTVPGARLIQVTNKRQVVRTTIGNQALKLFENYIILEQENSNLYIDFQTTVGTDTQYRDTDLAFAMGWKATTESTSFSDYTRIHGYDTTLLTRIQDFRNELGTFWCTDTGPVGGTGSQYWHWPMLWRGDVDIGNHAAGTKIYVACWVASDGNQHNYVLGGPQSGNTTDSGSETILNIWELSA